MRLELVVAASVVRDARVLLVWHKRHQEWLPPGGHIKENETPDDAVVREVREETGLEIEFTNQRNALSIEGAKRKLPIPFFADVHNVGDHDHCCFYYLVKPKNLEQRVRLNLNEVEDYCWFADSELNAKGIPADVKHISRHALKNTRAVTLLVKPVNSPS